MEVQKTVTVTTRLPPVSLEDEDKHTRLLFETCFQEKNNLEGKLMLAIYNTKKWDCKESIVNIYKILLILWQVPMLEHYIELHNFTPL